MVPDSHTRRHVQHKGCCNDEDSCNSRDIACIMLIREHMAFCWLWFSLFTSYINLVHPQRLSKFRKLFRKSNALHTAGSWRILCWGAKMSRSSFLVLWPTSSSWTQTRELWHVDLIVTCTDNSRRASLSSEDTEMLLQSLIGWLIQCLDGSVGPLVVKKLCSTLVTYFMHFSSSWTRCIGHLSYCICIGRAVPYQEACDAAEMITLIGSIPNSKALAMLWFTASLAEEVGKTDSNSMKQSVYSTNHWNWTKLFIRNQFHQRLVLNVDDVVALIARYIAADQNITVEAKVRQEAMRCFQVSNAVKPSTYSINLHWVSLFFSSMLGVWSNRNADPS